MKIIDYNKMLEEMKPFLVNGKRLASTEAQWLEKKGAVRLEEKLNYRKEKYFDMFIINVPRYQEMTTLLEDFGKCEYGQHKRLEELEKSL